MAELSKLTNEDPILVIEASNTIEEVDILVIGYFLLFHQYARERRIINFKIELRLTKNLKPFSRPDADELDKIAELDALKGRYENDTRKLFSDEVGWIIRQYMAYAFLQGNNNPFTVTYGYVFNYENEDGSVDDISIHSDRKSSWFVISGSFIPILRVNNISYELYFTERTEALELEIDYVYYPKNSELYSSVSAALKKRLYNKDIYIQKNKVKAFRVLTRLAFVQALSNARILNFYLNNTSSFADQLQAGSLKGQTAINYFRSIRPIFNELQLKPPIFHYIFSTLMASKLLPNKLNGDTKLEFETTIKSLWSFVKELIFGIQELAKNVVEHSTYHEGIITARTYKLDSYEKLNPELISVFRTYQQCLKKEHSSFFDVNVADGGLEGVLKTLTEQSKQSHQNHPSEELAKDIESLETNKITFGDLLNPNQPLRLFQQAKRATAHLGLLTLAKLVDNNHGLLRASNWETDSDTMLRASETIYQQQFRDKTAMIDYGTNYHFVLPINHEYTYRPQFHEETGIPEVSAEYALGIEHLSDFILIPVLQFKLENLDDHQIYEVRFQKPDTDDVKVDYWDIFPLRNIVRSDIKAKIAFCLHLDNINVDYDRLYRFLGNWELTFTGIPLILTGIATETHLRLVETIRMHGRTQQLPFWNEKSLIVVYNYVEHVKSNQRFYYIDVIWGESEIDYLALNKLISKSNFNSTSVLQQLAAVDNSESGDDQAEEVIAYELSARKIAALDGFGLFHHPGLLLPIDLIIKAGPPYSIYEQNALSLLQNRIATLEKPAWIYEDPLVAYFLSIPGYKIADSHFRIGSKLHVDSFYYAKRFFQNSFFASPIAFLLTQEILNAMVTESITWSDLKTHGITIFGYGQYSGLVLSLVEQFLIRTYERKTGFKQSVDKLEINYEIINDTEHVSFLKNEIVHGYGVLITPIASTFSTSIKMQTEIKAKYPAIQLFKLHLNVIYAHNSKKATIENEDIEYRFGIRHQDFTNRLVQVDAFSNQNRRVEQRFWLPLQTNWEPVENCNICRPKNERKVELPLFYTDKTMSTPSLIFSTPVSKDVEIINNNPFKLTRDSLKYGHYVDNNTHYLFYVEVNKFFQDNYGVIRDWLKKLRDSKSLKKCINRGDHVILIAPGHYSNTGFLNLVNEILFSNIATVIHYDAQSDHIQNFQLFYEQEIKRPGNTIIFVDDVIMSGNTFLRTNYFLKLNRERNKGFDACIVLLDRSDFHVHENLKRKLFGSAKVFFSFGSLHLPALSLTPHDCPICQEQERYEEIAANSFLDKVKFHFLEQASKITPISIDKLRKGLIDPQRSPKTLDGFKDTYFDLYYHEDSNRYIRRIDAIHRIYEWFKKSDNALKFEEQLSFVEWKQALRENTNSPILGSDLFKRNMEVTDSRYVSCYCSDTLLKVLTQYPFTQYKPVRERTFRWVMDFMREEVRAYTTKNIPFTNEKFRTLKFLIRRAGLLHQNYIISNDFFELLKAILGDQYIPKLITNEKETLQRISTEINDLPQKNRMQFEIDNFLSQYHASLRSLKNLNSFIWFLTGQIKELIHQNEARSIRLEETLLFFEKPNNNNPPLFKQLLRILREENGILFKRFAEFFKPHTVQNIGAYKYDTAQIYQALGDELVREHYRFQTLKFFLKEAAGGEPQVSEPLRNYLWLLQYLSEEQSGLQESLISKTATIMLRLQRILFETDEKCGSFFIVKYKKDKDDEYFIAYNDGEKGRLNTEIWKADHSAYIKNFLDGDVENNGVSMITITDLKRQGERWIDTFRVTNVNTPVNLAKDILTGNFNRLMMVRINGLGIESVKEGSRFFEAKDKPLGVIGFFNNKKESQPESNYNQRYLLLLRESLATFIKNHHENNEFRDWIDADNFRRVALLTGHGRDMLMRLATTEFPAYEGYLPYKRIVSTIHLIQHFILDIERDPTMKSIYKLLFKKYFSPIPVNIDSLKNIEKLVNHIHWLDEIENRAAVKFNFYDSINGREVITDSPLDPQIDFSLPLLDMIFFELAVNAKKNRWLLYPSGESNKVQLNVYKEGKNVIITFRNTGPEVSAQEMKNLNSSSNSKRENEASGIYLIKNLLHIFDLGEIGFYLSPIQQKLKWFNVKLTLYPWKNEESTTN
ncbi:hypothetical protein [Mucilaginibacter pankratovii]|uniref:hypothetical protein n=1 Tax=Mucilaginibacter pankratovii TaxID=2772110 RepID=UPI00174695FD|nr:hypothetical protein [Mucilaginibacter pankratovii]